jgi:Tfp pilus assembly protein PilF
MLIGLGSQLALQHNNNNKLTEAKDALECALHLNPYFDGDITQLAHVLVKLGETDNAQRVLEYGWRRSIHRMEKLRTHWASPI